MPIECTQVDGVDRSAGRTAYPQIPIARGDGRADRRGEQEGHALGLAFVPGRYQALSILEHLGVGRAMGGRLLLRGVAALILHLAAVEAHGRGFGRTVAAWSSNAI